MIVKYTRDNEAYVVDNEKLVPIDSNNRDYKEVQQWIMNGGVAAPAFTDEELAQVVVNEDTAIRSSMIEQGNLLRVANDDRLAVGATPIIADDLGHDAWMKELYDNVDLDDDVVLSKPPALQRQLLSIVMEDVDSFTFTRLKDQWGYRWKMNLHRESVNALALAIYDENGLYLYTTGALLDDGNGGWFTECPAGQADATPSDVHFRWLLGSAHISELELYEGAETILGGEVRSDERYD